MVDLRRQSTDVGVFNTVRHVSSQFTVHATFLIFSEGKEHAQCQKANVLKVQLLVLSLREKKNENLFIHTYAPIVRTIG